MKKSSPPKSKVNGSSYRELVRDVSENQWRMVTVGELREITRFGEKAMTRLRTLATKDADTDPWAGGSDLTRPEKFFDWYWGKRIELEKQFIVTAGGRVEARSGR